MEKLKAARDATINGIVIGALVGGAMLTSNQYNTVVVAKTAGGATLFRFAMYMIENVDEIEVGALGDLLGVPQADSDKAVMKISSFFKSYSFGKLI